jgi:two-component system, NtrC family, nitrogen regulation response regulator GlnG
MKSSRSDWERGLGASTEATAPRPVELQELRVPALTILAHPDLRRVGEKVLLPALTSGRGVPLSRLTPLFAPPDSSRERPLADSYLSRSPIQMIPELVPGGGLGSVRLVPENGARRFDVLGASSGEISATRLLRGAVIVLADRVALLLHFLPPALPRETERFGLVGDSAALAFLRREIRRTAGVSTPILLRGETGTGKELVAHAIHSAGPRRTRPYLALNLGAVPPALAASELFGAARGAFTGADRRRAGYFERADSGTLFLDEIGEAPPEVQIHLLRALESGEVQPVGAEAPLRVDVRVVAATDADLEAAVAQGRFRAPLLHRLSGYEIRLPPLRERRDDIGRLLVHFLRQELSVMGEERLLDEPGQRREPWLPAALVARLADHDWPGNVRELRNVARRIAVGSRDAAQAELPGELERAPDPAAVVQELPASLLSTVPDKPASRPREAYRPVSEVTEEELFAALRASRWNLAVTAERLRISRTSLYALVERHGGVRKASQLSRDEIASALERAGGDLDAAAADLRVSPHGLKIRRTELGIH